MVELAQTDWRQDVNTFARMLQQEDRAASWLKSYDEKAKKAGAAVRKANGEDTTYLALLASGDSCLCLMQPVSEVFSMKIWV